MTVATVLLIAYAVILSMFHAKVIRDLVEHTKLPENKSRRWRGARHTTAVNIEPTLNSNQSAGIRAVLCSHKTWDAHYPADK
jgi:hypothetical protein